MRPLLLALFLVICYTSSPAVGQDPEYIIIDVEEDIPANGRWSFDCTDGYTRDTSGLNCSEGGIEFPHDSYGEVGFWTQCNTQCRITYTFQPDDTTFGALLYQTGVRSMVSTDGVTWDMIHGAGWTFYYLNLDPGHDIHTVTLLLEYAEPTRFSLLDKLSVNIEMLYPSTIIPSSTTPPSETTTDSGLPTTPRPGDSCNEDCVSVGYCHEYFECVEGQWEKRNCTGRLMWNPLNPDGSPHIHGGNCDEYKNLRNETLEAYHGDENCLKCFWKELDEGICNSRYLYQEPGGEFRNVLMLSCSPGLVFSEVEKTCVTCDTYIEYDGKNCCGSVTP